MQLLAGMLNPPCLLLPWRSTLAGAEQPRQCAAGGEGERAMLPLTAQNRCCIVLLEAQAWELAAIATATRRGAACRPCAFTLPAPLCLLIMCVARRSPHEHWTFPLPPQEPVVKARPRPRLRGCRWTGPWRGSPAGEPQLWMGWPLCTAVCCMLHARPPPHSPCHQAGAASANGVPPCPPCCPPQIGTPGTYTLIAVDPVRFLQALRLGARLAAAPAAHPGAAVVQCTCRPCLRRRSALTAGPGLCSSWRPT